MTSEAQGEYIRLSDDKRFCMNEMKRSMQNNMAETAWPKVQYLWKLHPLFNWVNDKAGLLFGRGEAPLVGLPDVLSQDEIIFIMAGSIPNNKSTPLIDEWFGLRYKNGMFCNSLSMEKVMQITKFQNKNIPNTNQITEEDIAQTSSLLENAVANAKDYLYKFFVEYQERITPLLDEEIDKLAELEEKHKDYQMSLFDNERKRSEQERLVDELFDKFIQWVTDTLTIQSNPYIRIVAVLKGVSL